MNAFRSSFSAGRRELLVDNFTGVAPAACDAEAGEPEEAAPSTAFGRARCIAPLGCTSPGIGDRPVEGDEQFGGGSVAG